ncbi:MAG: hypothetical protein ABIA04_01290 [Pseudomonadota bacterium]
MEKIKYNIPKLESFKKHYKASCAAGESASGIEDCVNGTGDTQGECHNGSGASLSCSTGAGDIEGACSEGSSPSNYCVSGGDDV